MLQQVSWRHDDARLLAPSVTAQTAATGNIEGVVTDATGGVLPGVTVVVRNTDTNVARESVTDATGRYRAHGAAARPYEVTATLAGFQASADRQHRGPGRPDVGRSTSRCGRRA